MKRYLVVCAVAALAALTVASSASAMLPWGNGAGPAPDGYRTHMVIWAE